MGDWVKADDDSICQILRRGKMLRTNGSQYYVGTCTGTFVCKKSVKMDTDRRPNIYSFGGHKTAHEALEDRKELSSNALMFIQYVSGGMPTDKAYMKAFPTNNLQYARVKSFRLMKTERVKTAVKEELKPVLNNLGIDEEYILEGIKSEADTADKSDTRLKALFKLSDIMDLEDKNAAKVQQLTGISFQGFSGDELETADRKQLKESK